jgi:hypothetical protein
VRREAFTAVGGFDPVWFPAYFEDIDLCLRLRDAGYRVMFEPGATVTHIRYGSGSLDEATRLFLANRPRFVERWGRRLTGRPPSLDSRSPAAIISARDAPARGRVLVCDDRLDPTSVTRSSGVVDSVLAALPGARVTWCTDALAAGCLDVELWLRRGVEFVEDSSPDWLMNRRYGIDVIFGGEISDPRLSTALDLTQPQAHRVAVDAVDIASMPDQLADAGLSPVNVAARRS